jgi:DNA repair protein RadC
MPTLYIRTAEHFTAATEHEVIETAQALLSERFKPRTPILTTPDLVREFLKLHLAPRDAQAFAALFLSPRYRLIRYSILFRGTIDTVTVYPRTLVRECIELNARHVIVARNDVEGVSEPTDTDCALAHKLADALALIEVSLRDYFIVGNDVSSLAQQGLL